MVRIILYYTNVFSQKRVWNYHNTTNYVTKITIIIVSDLLIIIKIHKKHFCKLIVQLTRLLGFI